jgi:hypothetical protein
VRTEVSVVLYIVLYIASLHRVLLHSPPVLQLIVKRRAGGHGTSFKERKKREKRKKSQLSIY